MCIIGKEEEEDRVDVVSTSNWNNFWQAFASRGFVSDSWAFLFI